MTSTVLEVTLGMTFCYASIALIAGTVFEAGASLLKLRATCLLDGVKALLNDQAFAGLARLVYSHALVNPQDKGNTAPGDTPPVLPSYIVPRHFALALIESLQGASGTFQDLGSTIDRLPDPQLKQLLQGMYARAGGKVEALQAELTSWFDAGMDRVSGGYKRMAQLFTFLAALAVAGLLNVDSFHLFRALWQHPALLGQLSAPADAVEAAEALRALPIGWDTLPSSLPLAVGGWLVTASSALFGAPFWFDLLQRFVNLRGAGGKPDPATKSQ
jgi:hypothetical protein